MGWVFKVTNKEMLSLRNEIFLEKGVSALEKNGFQKAPFTSSCHGRDHLYNFDYDFCRLVKHHLEILNVFIARGDRWIQIRLNVFQLEPRVTSLKELEGILGIKYNLPPSNLTSMRLRVDDYRVIPLFVFLFAKEHKIESYNSRRGLNKRIEQLGNLIEKDMTNIDSFVSRWHELYVPPKVDWEGNMIE